MPNLYNYGKGRLWVAETDYLTFDGWFNIDVQDSQPNAVGSDNLGVSFIQKPPSTPQKEQWAVGGNLMVRRARILNYNNSGASTSRTWLEWLDYWVREQNQQMDFYLIQHGTDSAGSEFIRKLWYQLDILTIPGWMKGPLSNFGRPPRELSFPVVITDEGTFADFDQLEDSEPITGVDTGNDTFTVSGDYSGILRKRTRFSVSGSTGNNGNWACAEDSSYDSGADETTITVGYEVHRTDETDITDATVDGQINLGKLTRGTRP